MNRNDLLLDLARRYCERYLPDELTILEINEDDVERITRTASGQFIDALGSGIGTPAEAPQVVAVFVRAMDELNTRARQGQELNPEAVYAYLTEAIRGDQVEGWFPRHMEAGVRREMMERVLRVLAPEVRAADLKIEVVRDTFDGHPSLRYILDSEVVGYHRKPLRGPVCPQFEGNLDAFRRFLTQEILKQDPSIDRIARIGNWLYEQLFPQAMREEYRRFRKLVKTILITSQEPWIPWELLKPFDGSVADAIDDDFLGLEFQLCRWLADTRPPEKEIFVGRLACVDASHVQGFKPLPQGRQECLGVRELAHLRPEVEDLSPPVASQEELIRLLREESPDLLHIVAHGYFDRDSPFASRIALDDQEYLEAIDVTGPLAFAVSRTRPLVFMSACDSAQLGWALTGLDGWAEAWIQRASCGAFISPWIAMPDGACRVFAEAFYEALRLGKTFGQASQGARQAIERQWPGSPLAIPFVVYAHPNGRLQLA